MSKDYDKPWRVLKSSFALRDNWLTIRSDKVVLPSGQLSDYHTMVCPDWVSIMAITVDARLVLVEQYRHPIERTIVEFPAGSVDAADKTPLDAAKRELLEETGYISDEWHFLGACAANPARQTNQSFGYLTFNAKKTGASKPEETEFIRTKLVPLEEFRRGLQTSDIQLPAYHLCCLWWLEQYSRRTGDPRVSLALR